MTREITVTVRVRYDASEVSVAEGGRRSPIQAIEDRLHDALRGVEGIKHVHVTSAVDGRVVNGKDS